MKTLILTNVYCIPKLKVISGNFFLQKLDSEMRIQSASGEERPAMDIIAKSLEYMKKHSAIFIRGKDI